MMHHLTRFGYKRMSEDYYKTKSTQTDRVIHVYSAELYLGDVISLSTK